MDDGRVKRFAGRWKWLSNFWRSPVKFEGIEYPTVEHAYQAAKTLDLNIREEVRLSPTPGKAKFMGRHLPLRPDWEDVKLDIMEQLLREKFVKDSMLAQMLDNTGNAQLIEGNYWGDTFWGVCDGVGENHLGKLLMKVRSINREE